MTSLLQLLVAVGVAIAGAVVALRMDKKEHMDRRQEHMHFPEQSDEIKPRGVAMSQTTRV